MIRGLVVALSLWLAAILQEAVARHISVFGARPDFIIIAIAVCGLCLERMPATFAGFAGGVVQGALVGANLSHYVVSRTLGGFCAAWSRRMRVEMTAPTVGLTVAALTLVTQIAFMFTAGPSGILRFLGDTIGSAVYNGVIAMPVYALLKKVLNPPVR